jgi:polar amino acid transport system substrate-binding protein
MKKSALVLLLLLIPFLAWGESPLVFLYNEYPPFEYKTEKGHAGISIERIEKAAAKADILVEFRHIPWSRALYMMKTGQADAIFSLYKTKERGKYLDYVQTPLAEAQDVIISLNSATYQINSFDELKKYRIGLIQDNSHGKLFDELQGLNKDFSVSKDIFLIKKLLAKRIELIVITKEVFLHLIKVHHFERSNFKIHPLIVNKEKLYLAFAKKGEKSKALARLFTEKLNEIQ